MAAIASDTSPSPKSGRRRITEDAVRRATIATGTLFLRDDRQIGFGLRVTEKGAKSFIVEGRVNGHMRRFTIGSAERFTVNDARARAKKLLADMQDGVDPRLKRRSGRERSDTLRSMLETYIGARNLKSSTAEKYRAQMRRNLPDWLEKPIADITPQMVVLRYEGISKRSVAEANGTMRAFRAVCRRAMKILPDKADGTPLMARLPTGALAGSWRTLRRKTTLLETDEIPAWWLAVDQLKSEVSKRALFGLLLTGLRTNELLHLEWDDVDEGRQRLFVRESKTGPFEKVIGPELAALFAHWRIDGKGRRPFAVDDLRAALSRVVRLGGKRITPHDLRRTYLTVGERMGVPMVALKKLANHSISGDVTTGYVLPSELDLRHWASVIERAILDASRTPVRIAERPSLRETA